MKKAAAWALCVLWMMVIFMMSEMSGDVSGAQSGFVTELVEKRAAAKKAKDWATADAIRAELTAMGWAVKDTAQGPQLSKL